MLSKISQTNTALYHLYGQCKTTTTTTKVKLIETESRMMVLGPESRGNSKGLVKIYKHSVIRRIGSEELMYNMVTLTDNNSIL